MNGSEPEDHHHIRRGGGPGGPPARHPPSGLGGAGPPRPPPDRESGLVGWDTVDGINAELQDDYEQWGVTADGCHCCTDCLNVTDDDRYVTPDGLTVEPLDAITMPNNGRRKRDDRC